ncbi:hypothetical protein Tco_0602344 [Tanacetum coccineum]
MPPQRTFVLTAPPPRCDVAESSAATARAPRGQYDFVDTIEAGQGLIRSPGHDGRTIARADDRAEDVVYVHKRESEDFYSQLLDTRTDRRDIRLKIDVVRGQRTAYETELHEVRQAYLSSEARNRALLAHGTCDGFKETQQRRSKAMIYGLGSTPNPSYKTNTSSRPLQCSYSINSL